MDVPEGKGFLPPKSAIWQIEEENILCFKYRPRTFLRLQFESLYSQATPSPSRIRFDTLRATIEKMKLVLDSYSCDEPGPSILNISKFLIFSPIVPV